MKSLRSTGSITWRVLSPTSILLLITLLAAFLRLYKLGEWSFWEDEIFTLSSKADGLHATFLGESLARALIQWTVARLGESEWTARLVPALIGIASIPILYFPIRSQFGEKTALLGSALLAVSPWHIYWSQTARFYVLLVLFASLSLLYLAMSVSQRRVSLALASLLFLLLAVRESLVGLFIIPVALAYLLFSWLSRERRRSVRWRIVLPLLGVALLLVAALTAPYWRNLGVYAQGFGRINNTPLWILGATAYYVSLPVVCLGLFMGLTLISRRAVDGYLLVFWAALPLVAVAALAPFQYTATRYSFLSLPGWIILASLGVTQLNELAGESERLLAVGVIALLLASPLAEDFLYFAYQGGNRENGRAAYGYISAQLQPGDLVVASTPSVADYYLGMRTLPMAWFDPGHLEDFRRVWFVEDLDSDELYPTQMEWVMEHALRITDFDVYAGPRIFKMRIYLHDIDDTHG